MARKFVRILTSSRLERHDAIDQAKAVLNDSGAWIMDFKMFSNNVLNIQFVIELGDIKRLEESLNQSSLLLFSESTVELQQMVQIAEEHSSKPDEEVFGTLVVNFVHQDPDLIIEVPAVPG